jgi:hypothetical protein
MTRGLQDKNFSFYPTCDVWISNAYPINLKDCGTHAAFDQNKSIYFENQVRYGIIVKEVYISF